MQALLRAVQSVWTSGQPRALSSAAATPVKFLALRYSYVDGMLEKRDPYRAEHLEKAREVVATGKVALFGAFTPCDGAVLLFHMDKTTKEEVEAFAKADPYVMNGLVCKWDVAEYNAVFGSFLDA